MRAWARRDRCRRLRRRLLIAAALHVAGAGLGAAIYSVTTLAFDGRFDVVVFGWATICGSVIGLVAWVED